MEEPHNPKRSRASSEESVSDIGTPKKKARGSGRGMQAMDSVAYIDTSLPYVGPPDADTAMLDAPARGQRALRRGAMAERVSREMMLSSAFVEHHHAVVDFLNADASARVIDPPDAFVEAIFGLREAGTLKIADIKTARETCKRPETPRDESTDIKLFDLQRAYEKDVAKCDEELAELWSLQEWADMMRAELSTGTA
ncbi:hypothetical protein LTR53_006192 [Teratosphaeriaceae sp. CCFEE 6253]|nr:hypothetical protein LTR53_006192 [Teratosphaeriaceae sp. CCFEE 6253]